MTNCCICATSTARYKCPSCLQPYCSVPCYRTHKEKHVDDSSANVAATASASSNRQDGPDQIPNGQAQPQSGVTSLPAPVTSNSNDSAATATATSPFDALLSYTDLAQLFKRYPVLRDQLRTVYDAMREPAERDSLHVNGETFSNDDEDAINNDGNGTAGFSYRGRGSARYGRSRGRGRGRGGGYRAPWTPERGRRDGLFRLRQADKDEDVSEGLLEFRQLVLRYCAVDG